MTLGIAVLTAGAARPPPELLDLRGLLWSSPPCMSIMSSWSCRGGELEADVVTAGREPHLRHSSSRGFTVGRALGPWPSIQCWTMSALMAQQALVKVARTVAVAAGSGSTTLAASMQHKSTGRHHYQHIRYATQPGTALQGKGQP